MKNRNLRYSNNGDFTSEDFHNERAKLSFVRNTEEKQFENIPTVRHNYKSFHEFGIIKPNLDLHDSVNFGSIPNKLREQETRDILNDHQSVFGRSIVKNQIRNLLKTRTGYHTDVSFGLDLNSMLFENINLNSLSLIKHHIHSLVKETLLKSNNIYVNNVDIDFDSSTSTLQIYIQIEENPSISNAQDNEMLISLNL